MDCRDIDATSFRRSDFHGPLKPEAPPVEAAPAAPERPATFEGFEAVPVGSASPAVPELGAEAQRRARQRVWRVLAERLRAWVLVATLTDRAQTALVGLLLGLVALALDAAAAPDEDDSALDAAGALLVVVDRVLGSDGEGRDPTIARELGRAVRWLGGQPMDRLSSDHHFEVARLLRMNAVRLGRERYALTTEHTERLAWGVVRVAWATGIPLGSALERERAAAAARFVAERYRRAAQPLPGAALAVADMLRGARLDLGTGAGWRRVRLVQDFGRGVGLDLWTGEGATLRAATDQIWEHAAAHVKGGAA